VSGRGRGEERRRARLRQRRRGIPELAYVTARHAALAPFGKVAALLSELLPVSGIQHTSTVRSRTLRAGAEVAQANAAETAKQSTAPATGGPVVVGLDGGYVRRRHRAEGRCFEVIAGKVIRADGAQHRFALPLASDAHLTPTLSPQTRSPPFKGGREAVRTGKIGPGPLTAHQAQGAAARLGTRAGQRAIIAIDARPLGALKPNERRV
jgi:hypothetical protein